MRAVAVLSVLVALTSRPVAAQATDNPALCWNPRPAPACRKALITELGVATSLERTPVVYLTSEVGFMKTTSSHSAVGLSVFSGLLHDDGRLGLKLRYRHWFGANTVVEGGAGPLLVNSSFRARNLGLVAHASLGYRDWIAVTTQFELGSYETGMRARTFVGTRVGSYPGFGANMLGAILGLILFSFSDPFDNAPN